jgi:hypothetical protein
MDRKKKASYYALECANKRHTTAWKELLAHATEDFTAGAEWAYKWTSVDKELPETQVPVLVRYNKDYQFYAVCRMVECYDELIYRFRFYAICEGELIEDVTHWRYIELR